MGTFETDHPTICLYPIALDAIDKLRDFMFERVYGHERTLEGAALGQSVITTLFEYYMSNPADISGWSLPQDPVWRRAADYISGMTDHYALDQARVLKLL